MISFTFELIRDYEKCAIHELMHHIWLSVRLNNLIARYKINFTIFTVYLLFVQQSTVKIE